MKTMKKALALVLALALTVTAVPVTNAAAATAPKLSQKSVTVAGNATKQQTKSIKVITPSTWKSVKVTASSADKKVATVAVSKKTVKVTAVKKGETKVTVKVTGKKSGKAVKKSLTLKVTTCGAGLAVTAPKELTVGESAKLTVKTTPSVAICSYESADSKIATVSSNGTVTAVAAGTVKISVKTDYGKEKNVTVTVKEAEPVKTLNMIDLKATAADTLTATFESAVATDNVTVSLTRGTTAVENKITWDADKKVATVKTSAKMAPGTYVLKVTDKTNESDTTSKEVAVEKQQPTEIVILNDVALTGKKGALESGYAYVYYDVVDQYGESVRNSTSITWSTSAHIASKNNALGLLTLDRTDGKDFTYSEQIFVTGVCTTPTLTVTKTLTVGAKQSVDSVSVKGFIKAGTTEILDSLPADFRDLEYQMLYTVTDKNGNPVANRKTYAKDEEIEDVKFISKNPLIISEIKKARADVTINGEEYHAVLVTPGIQVEKGGEVPVQAIATNTGNEEDIIVPVNMSEVLNSFVIGDPADIVADGETVKLPFTATSTSGQKVTSFRTIAKQESFNKLQFTVSESGAVLTLKEANDGTAELTYADKALSWGDSQTTDGLDRMVVLTSVVVGGETSNTTLYIRDKARPSGIKEVGFHSAYVEGDTAKVELANYNADVKIVYVDQYGRDIKDGAAKAFFQASADGILQNTDFSGYLFGTMMTYTGNGASAATTALQKLVSNDVKDIFLTVNAPSEVINMATTLTAPKSGEGWKFGVAKYKATEGYSYVEKTKYYEYAVVDILNVQGLTVGGFGKFFVETDDSDASYGDGTISTQKIPNYTGNPETFTTTGVITANNYQQKVSVSGSYAGKSDVRVPAEYYTVSAEYLKASKHSDGAYWIDDVQNLTADELYDVANGNGNDSAYPRKDASDIIKIQVKEVYLNKSYKAVAANTKGYIGDKYTDAVDYQSVQQQVADLAKAVTMSDAAPKATSLKANMETAILNPNGTSMTINKDTAYNGKKLFTLSDQYGKDISNNLTFEVKDVKEAVAYATNNFATTGNDTATVNVVGAERTDEFVVQALFKDLTASVKCTAGADAKSFINQSINSYLADLIKNYLEPQRVKPL